MACCKRLPTCSFYQGKMVVDTGIGELLKAKYCNCNNIENCARNIVFTELGPEYVDDTLFPNMVQRAYEMIAANKAK